ncbi:MAG: peroxiredoxin-like family protein [Balneola sp.]|jgi:peroxiredoxin|tara:strand:+ start:357957 stop:358493 length:537 start_codon:yes stop_codon:yes gene_type:complete
MKTLTPRTQTPDLSFPLTNGDTWNLSEQDPDSFTMVVFYRGLHCPVCKGYTQSLNKLVDDFKERGVETVTVSMDSEKRARTSIQEWEVDKLKVGYDLSEEQAHNWGLYLSNAINDNEPELFSEPGLFLIRPDGKLYYSAVNSMPFGRPVLKDMLKAIDFIQEKDYPARGEVKAMELQD